MVVPKSLRKNSRVKNEEDDEDFDPANATLPDSTSDDDLDYVSQHDSSIESIDSDAPLESVFLQRNAPGSKSWRWTPGEAVPRKHTFAGAP